ncbi:gamma-glutamyl hydrolase 2-like isoform X2 [Punica granatum]|uniref:folate gamma-glutamyl hydrolase n=1 Tax=Punica granatum TaxID=22663 RepID=A0A218XVB1_PUNGR|nr:gamma-glutamyl hydrolase 2-like isoform X2 [Punica granatum]OWM88576.1 hypothetical protein CDL15_Pgr002343 [Punica granatum]
MASHFLSNSSPNPSAETSNLEMPKNEAVSASSSSSSSSSGRYTEIWNYLWIPLLISFSKELSLARAANSTILMPTQLEGDSRSLSVPRCPAPDPKLNFRPVIGILSHPGDGASGRLNNASNASYIAASYVKFVESAGARVIPLIYTEPPEILYEKLNMVNGVLFTGGWAKSGLYYETVKGIFKKVLAKNDAGDHFPLYAICLGFELLTMLISKNRNILEKFDATDQASTLQFVKDTDIEGTVFQRFTPDLRKKLSTDCLVMQNHHYGISPGRLLENSDLSSFFKVLTTSADGENKVYVSTVQARSYPVTAFQWHPEKNAFEWGLSMIPHSDDAIQVTQHVANFFVSEARKSLNRPSARKVLDNLIYNYSPTYCGRAGKGYDEVYIFT